MAAITPTHSLTAPPLKVEGRKYKKAARTFRAPPPLQEKGIHKGLYSILVHTVDLTAGANKYLH